ncbi:oligosaccharide MFS transporter [Staphylococcus gallinarum]|uniref:oligosaccharide MFS transporter n=1 Tax=Staphylococcus gallinarum TaxID=1293 RepID=UPI001E2B93A4|nr:oligosaccharide MFS transporter [Staphylococcus gallinarum]MCD8844132.1 oligosaccharide MFS transporter [Staphylococcus gallinarum]
MKFSKYVQPFKNVSYIQSSLTMFLYFASWSIWWSLFQIWLASKDSGLGLSGTEIGTIYSVNSLFTIVLLFVYGLIQDKLVIKRTLVIFCASASILVGPFFTLIYKNLIQQHFILGVIVGSIFLSAGFLSASGVYETISEKLSRFFNFKYGQARAWGSVGFAVSALIAGHLFVINPDFNFWLGSVLGLLLLINLLLLKPKKEKEMINNLRNNPKDDSIPTAKDMIATLKMKHLWIVMLFIMFTGTFYGIYDGQMFPDFYTKLFDNEKTGQTMYGNLNSLQVFCEAIMMGIVPIIMMKIGVKPTLMLGVTVMFTRIGLSAVTDSPILMSMIKMMHALEVPLFMLPTFRYITLHFDPKLSATLYLVGLQISGQIGSVLLSTPLGMLRDAIGYNYTFIIISIIVMIAGAFGYLLLKNDNEMVDGDPFLKNAQITN